VPSPPIRARCCGPILQDGGDTQRRHERATKGNTHAGVRFGEVSSGRGRSPDAPLCRGEVRVDVLGVANPATPRRRSCRECVASLEEKSYCPSPPEVAEDPRWRDGRLCCPRRELQRSGPPSSAASRSDTPSAARNHALLYLTYVTGLRIGETLALRVQDVNLDLLKVHVTQGRTGVRIVPLPDDPRLVTSLTRWLQIRETWPASELLFITRSGAPLDSSAVRSSMALYGARSGIGHVRPHMLRHSAATEMLANGAPPIGVQRVLWGIEACERRWRRTHTPATPTPLRRWRAALRDKQAVATASAYEASAARRRSSFRVTRSPAESEVFQNVHPSVDFCDGGSGWPAPDSLAAAPAPEGVL
jgi:hypothetical protein